MIIPAPYLGSSGITLPSGVPQSCLFPPNSGTPTHWHCKEPGVRHALVGLLCIICYLDSRPPSLEGADKLTRNCAAQDAPGSATPPDKGVVQLCTLHRKHTVFDSPATSLELTKNLGEILQPPPPRPNKWQGLPLQGTGNSIKEAPLGKVTQS